MNVLPSQERGRRRKENEIDIKKGRNEGRKEGMKKERN